MDTQASLKNWGHDFLQAEGKERPGEEGKGDTARNKQKQNAPKNTHEKAKAGEKEGPNKGGRQEASKDEARAGAKRKLADDEPKASKDEGSENGSGGGGLEKGDTVTWKWGQGHPQGEVLDVKGEK